MRSKKKCKECDNVLPAATKKCNKCGYVFFERRKRRLPKNLIDWKTLKPKQEIKLYGADYYKINEEETIDMSNNGKYTVVDIDEKGLVLYGKNGFCYQNMVNSGLCEAGFIRVIPKIGTVNVRGKTVQRDSK